MTGLTIGQVARRSGVPAKTIRYYESVGLVRDPRRADNGYRQYDPRSVAELRFVQRARSLGFTLKEVGGLLALWGDEHRRSAEVKALALTHVADVERRIEELETIRRTLLDLAERCHGDHRPDCPILDELADTKED